MDVSLKQHEVRMAERVPPAMGVEATRQRDCREHKARLSCNDFLLEVI